MKIIELFDEFQSKWLWPCAVCGSFRLTHRNRGTLKWRLFSESQETEFPHNTEQKHIRTSRVLRYSGLVWFFISCQHFPWAFFRYTMTWNIRIESFWCSGCEIRLSRVHPYASIFINGQLCLISPITRVHFTKFLSKVWKNVSRTMSECSRVSIKKRANTRVVPFVSRIRTLILSGSSD